jgi:uncharacterized protein with HEPN domain
MSERSADPHLNDIVEAIGRVRKVLGDMPLDAFAADWQKQWLVERGVEIISEASRRLSAGIKGRYPEIPWPKVAGNRQCALPQLRKRFRPCYVETLKEDPRISCEFAAKTDATIEARMLACAAGGFGSK